MNESFSEKARAVGVVPLRSFGRLALRHLPERSLSLNRHDLHLFQLWHALKDMRPHHSRHNLINRFAAELSSKMLSSWEEAEQVVVLGTLQMQGNVRHDSVELLTKNLTLLRSEINAEQGLNEQEIVRMAHSVQFAAVRTDDLYRRVAYVETPIARTTAPVRPGTIPTVEELIVPTIIPSIVMSFTGLGIQRSGDPAGSPLAITFRSVPLNSSNK
jgi:hypothetical protein